jgi:hypothetical protein
MDKQRLARIEEYVFGLFRAAGTTRVLAREVFDEASGYANADLVRAFEHLEKKRRLLVRYTDEGNDWLQLTPEGAARAGLAGLDEPETPAVFPHPPKSST